ncbi:MULTISPECIES: restriction endonuclease [Cyanophyceae]|uniref:restriction endonuclease n=1 Tax=Cyanophyceae TaxID=3028117 RepID=UPI0016841C85|nr:restriction endonuclease [Trichocoleus sp. FACHB-69]MBD1932271.1 restriction endonuclease [Trichocoleus sp. FACHB-69]
MPREKYFGEDAARKDLGTPQSKPAWLESQHSLPFHSLSADEFEIFCYLLLRQENPGENIFYYGKTGDAGRDIVRIKPDRSVELIQCKRYQNNVGISEVRTEIAKLYINLHHKIIPDCPNKVTFYVVPDLTAPAQDLIFQHSKWLDIAESALAEYLKKAPPKELLDFSLSWYPQFSKETAIDLTQRAWKHQDLIEEFFRHKKVIDSDDPKLNAILNQGESAKSQLDELPNKVVEAIIRQLYLQPPKIVNAPDDIQKLLSHEFLSKSEQENPGLAFTVQRSTQETVLIIQPKPSAGSGTYGTLSFPNTAAGRQGKLKFKIFEEEGQAIRLEPGEYEWTWTPTLCLPQMQGELEIHPVVPQREIPISLKCLQDKEMVASVDFAYLRIVRIGTNEIEFCMKGGHLAGLITIVVSFLNKPLRFNLAANLGSVKAEQAKCTVQLLLAMLRGGRLQIKSWEFDAPLVINFIVTNSDLRQEKLEEYIKFLDYLIKINREFNLDLRYPNNVDANTEETVELIVSAIEHGQIEYPSGTIRLHRRQEALKIVELLRTRNPLNLEMEDEKKYQLIGHDLLMGKSRIIFENIFPIDGLLEMEQAVQALPESDNLQIALRYDRAIETFLQWFPEGTDGQTD